MTPKIQPAKGDPVPPPRRDHRIDATAEKLRAALDRFVHGVPDRGTGAQRAPRLTVAALAREAGIGRNAIYTNHRDILEDLAKARSLRPATDHIGGMKEKIAEQHAIIAGMQLQIRQLATKNAGLLRRALEAERSVERTNRRNARLTQEIEAHRHLVLLRQTET